MYYKGNLPPLISEEALVFFKSNNVEILDVEEANTIDFERVCQLRSDVGNFPKADQLPPIATPRLDFRNLLLPFAADELHERYVGNEPASTLIERYVSSYFQESKYLFVTDRSACVALRFNEFKNEIMLMLSFGHMNSSAVLFDASYRRCVCFHYDICCTFVGRSVSVGDHLGGKDDNFWIDFYEENFWSGMSNYGDQSPVIMEYFVQPLADQYDVEGILSRRSI